jgi:hypothetical protein
VADHTAPVPPSRPEESLAGGNLTAVSRVGDTVRRAAGPWTPTIHALLRHLRAAGITEVPEALGIDDQGREMLSYRPGKVANYPLPSWLWTDQILLQAGALLRRVHVAPYNMVFESGRLVGLIDVDTASPGPRIWDLAYLAYRLVPFVEDAGLELGWPQRAARLGRLLDAYRADFTEADVLGVMGQRLHELAGFTDVRAEQTGRVDFVEHAAMYRRDAEVLARRAAAASGPAHS